MGLNSKAIDANASYLGVSTKQLMENAGQAITRETQQYRDPAVFAGKGNNGGDGMVAARLLASSGKQVTVYALTGKRSRLCQLNYERLPEYVKIVETESEEDVHDLDGHGVIIDALLGTGFAGEVREPVKSIIKKINSSSKPKVSVDTPSAGMVESDMVIGLHKSKIIGSKVVDIGIPPEAETHCGPGDLITLLPPRRKDSHKGEHGRLLVVGGSMEYVGTPTLVAQSALKTGIDLAYLTVPKYVADKMPFDPNLIVNPPVSDEYISPQDVDEIDYMKFDCIAVGNGMGTNQESRKALEKIMSWKIPTVADADAITLMEKKWLHEKCILTPHRREFQALFGKEEETGGDFVESCSAETGAVIILKGMADIVSNGETTRINKTGNPYMSVGGTGDVLAGITAGLLSQSKKPFESACAGAFLAGLAGDLAAQMLSESLTATDMIARIPEAIRESRRHGE